MVTMVKQKEIQRIMKKMIITMKVDRTSRSNTLMVITKKHQTLRIQKKEHLQVRLNGAVKP